ncbi:hypothetical protein AAGW05_07090 [Arthrobacter sp. LAPM80]|uniref:hypothetical protein n=1 Tax=Arthrobacter sp. LAPM80 TaxID=3141788 RepID=UPI00398B7E99
MPAPRAGAMNLQLTGSVHPDLEPAGNVPGTPAVMEPRGTEVPDDVSARGTKKSWTPPEGGIQLSFRGCTVRDNRV